MLFQRLSHPDENKSVKGNADVWEHFANIINISRTHQPSRPGDESAAALPVASSQSQCCFFVPCAKTTSTVNTGSRDFIVLFYDMKYVRKYPTF